MSKHPDPPKCSVCPNGTRSLVTGRDIYPHREDLHNQAFWMCNTCGGYVGCHPGSTRPLGTTADQTLRRARNRAHAAFDPLWKTKGLQRREAYKLLAESLAIPFETCHIAMFDASQCEATVRFAHQIRP